MSDFVCGCMVDDTDFVCGCMVDDTDHRLCSACGDPSHSRPCEVPRHPITGVGTRPMSDPLTALAEALPEYRKLGPRPWPEVKTAEEFAADLLRNLAASGYTLVPAERLARLERIEAAARPLVKHYSYWINPETLEPLRAALSESETP